MRASVLISSFSFLLLIPLGYGFFQPAEQLTTIGWGLWIFFYLLAALFLIMLVFKREFRSTRDLYIILVLNTLIAMSMILKMVPLPMGMTLTFIIPLLTGCLVKPSLGGVIGFFSILFSALLFGGLGPWSSMQLYLMVVMCLGLTVVPFNMRRHAAFIIIYGSVWGVLFGFFMTLYFWPMSGMIYGLENPNQHFLSFYMTTSLMWDVFRAIGNGIFLYIFKKPFEILIASSSLVQRRFE